MQWSHNDVWMVTGDHAGYIKYWQSNMNNVKMFQVGLMITMLSKITGQGRLDPSQQNICWKQPIVQAHKEAIRRVSFCPTDAKFASCSDDGTVSLSLSICPWESK